MAQYLRSSMVCFRLQCMLMLHFALFSLLLLSSFHQITFQGSRIQVSFHFYFSLGGRILTREKLLFLFVFRCTARPCTPAFYTQFEMNQRNKQLVEKKITQIADKGQNCLLLAFGGKPRYLIRGSSLSQGSLKVEADRNEGIGEEGEEQSGGGER